MVNKFWPATELTGGANSLAAISAAEVEDGDAAFVVMDGVVAFYRMDVSSGVAHNPPEIIAPDNVGGADFRWVRIGFLGNEPISIDSIDNWQLYAGRWSGHKNTSVGTVTNPEDWEEVTGDVLATGLADLKTFVVGESLYLWGADNNRNVYKAAVATPTVFTLVATDWVYPYQGIFLTHNDTVYLFGTGQQPWKDIATADMNNFEAGFTVQTTYAPDTNILVTTAGGGIAFIVGDYAYIVGGVDDNWDVNLTVQRAPLTDLLGGWEEVSGKTLPHSFYLAPFASVGDNLYIYGGWTNGDIGQTARDSILTATKADPTTWSVVSDKTLPTGVAGAAIYTTPDYVYLVGGASAPNTGTDVIQRAPVSDPTTFEIVDGKVFPLACWTNHNSMFIDDGVAYVFGGNHTDNMTFTDKIFRTTVV